MKIKSITFFQINCALLLISQKANANDGKYDGDNIVIYLLTGLTFLALLVLVAWLSRLSNSLNEETAKITEPAGRRVAERLSNLSKKHIKQLLKHLSKNSVSEIGREGKWRQKSLSVAFVLIMLSISSSAQAAGESEISLNSPGMYIMLALILIPFIGIVLFACIKVSFLVKRARAVRIKKKTKELIEQIEQDGEFSAGLVHRNEALSYKLKDTELAGYMPADDKKGLLHNIAEVDSLRFISPKRKAAARHNINSELVKLILWFLCTATFWLVVGTTIGEYIGIKFVAPDADHISWLSFGRLRPTHTNMVFWGWSSLAMFGLGYYVVSTVSNMQIFSIRWGYYSLILINLAVLTGSICLMGGINNGGGEYREYTWPVMGVFAAAIIVTLVNFLKTIARRKTSEIYISNWYIVASVIFLSVIVVVGYIPWWQNGLGETIIQGFYMHQAVGMWFMLFNLGLIYYFLPQQLNTSIYSYSLGILAFWSQILFYTLIGTHHFLFSSIPWWLQTVAIVGSVGMLIPVFSGTTNFLMTIRGNYHKIARSYTLPFYLTGITFYFIGSTQGTAEAFRSTNLIWHFTDFTVAHSHITMYGIIAFMLWACIYTLVPRLTGREARQGLVGAHFWMALVGILFYSIPLMVGGTLKGMGWVEERPFIDGVIMMAPYWLWRAIGGSLMWGAHLIFAWNLYAMIAVASAEEVQDEIFDKLNYLPADATIKSSIGHL